MVPRASLWLGLGLVVGCNAVAGLDGLEFEAGSTTSTTSGGLGGQGGDISMVSTTSTTGGAGGCALGFADCDGQASNGCEQSLDADDHCGRCDRVCETTCDEGLCEPRVLYEGFNAPQGMTLVDDTLYLCDFSAGELLQMNKDGDGAAQVLVPNVAGCAGVHHDQDYLYFASFTDDCLTSITFPLRRQLHLPSCR